MTEALNTDTVQIGITLASIAYLGKDSDPKGEFEAMAKALQQKDLPTQTQWGLVWGPGNLESNLMYIVQGPATTYGRKYALVIRGTIFSFTSILEDLELDLVDLGWTNSTAPKGTKISKGVNKAFGRLLEIKDGGGRKAMDFLNALSGRNEILVCGHSLGGCLTTVMSLYLQDNLSGWLIRSAPFAGQTAGNQTFAKWYETQLGAPSRWFNSLDIVPRLWNYTTLDGIKKLFPDGPPCDPAFKLLVDAALHAAGKNYFQPGSGTSLPGAIYKESGSAYDQFKAEVEAQHDHIYYMYLTGIKLSVIQGTPICPGLGSGWWPPGAREHA